jgi:hypothetical protein
MQDNDHDAYTKWIIEQIRTVNPYNLNDDRKGYVYASGFLASYLASLMQEDPWLARKFRKHIQELKRSK